MSQESSLRLRIFHGEEAHRLCQIAKELHYSNLVEGQPANQSKTHDIYHLYKEMLLAHGSVLSTERGRFRCLHFEFPSINNDGGLKLSIAQRLKGYPIWFRLRSTESQVGYMLLLHKILRISPRALITDSQKLTEFEDFGETTFNLLQNGHQTNTK